MVARAKRWVQISVTADRDAVDDIVGYLNRYCTGGAVVEELAPEIDGPISDRVTVKGFLSSSDEENRQKLEIALLLLSRASGISEPITTLLEPEDWAESWKAYFPPLQLGQRTVIVPTWREYQARPGDIVLRLDPGMAFGTGLHASTRLCLVALEQFIAPGLCVLDVGTGSGILAISAALQGAARVDAIDTDPVAVDVTLENAALNHVEDRVCVTQGTLPGDAPQGMPIHTGTDYELLLVNILAEIIIGMADGIAGALASGGHVIASGIIKSKSEAVAQALTQAGLVVDKAIPDGDWIALVGHKP